MPGFGGNFLEAFKRAGVGGGGNAGINPRAQVMAGPELAGGGLGAMPPPGNGMLSSLLQARAGTTAGNPYAPPMGAPVGPPQMGAMKSFRSTGGLPPRPGMGRMRRRLR